MLLVECDGQIKVYTTDYNLGKMHISPPDNISYINTIKIFKACYKADNLQLNLPQKTITKLRKRQIKLHRVSKK